MDLLIKGGKVVTAKSTFKADVAVKNGKISAIGTNLKPLLPAAVPQRSSTLKHSL